MSSYKTKPMNFGSTTNGTRRGGPPPAPGSNTVLASSAPVVSSRFLKSTPTTRPRHGQPPPLPASFQAAQAQAQQAASTPSVAAAVANFSATPSLTSTAAPSSPSGLKKSLSAHALSKQQSTDLSNTTGAGSVQGANGSGSYHKKNASSGGGGGSKYDREGNLITHHGGGGSGGHTTGSGSGGHSTGSGKKKDHSSPPFHPKNLNTRHHKNPSGTNSSPQLKSTGLSRSNPPSPTAANHMNGSGGMPKLGLPSPRFKALGGSGSSIPPPTHSQQPSYSLQTASHNQQPSLSQFSTSGSISVYRESTQQSSNAPLLSPSRLHGHNNHVHGAHPTLHSSHQLHHHAPTTTSPSQIRLQWASNTSDNKTGNNNSNPTSPSSHPPTPSSPNVRAKQEPTSPTTLSANADTIKDLLLSIKKNPQFSSMVEYSIACLGSLCEDAVSMAEIVNAGATGSTGQDASLAITPAERLMAVLANTISRMNLNNQLAAVLTQSGAVGALLSALQHFNAPATHVYVCLALDKLISASHSSLNVAAMSPSKRNRSLTSDPNANKPSHSSYHHQHHQSTHATPYNNKNSSTTPLFSPSSPSHSSPAACAPLAISLHDTTPFLIQSGCLSRLEQLSRAAFTVMNHANERSCHTSLVIEQAQLLDAVGMLLAQMIRGGDHLTREHMNKVKATVSAIIDAASSTLQQSMDQKGKTKENNDRVWAAHHAVAFLVRLLEDPPSPPVSAIPGTSSPSPSSSPPPPPPSSLSSSSSSPSVLHDIIRQYMIESGTVDALVAALEHHSLAPYESVAAAARKTTISYSASMSSHHKKMAQKLPYSQHASSSSLVTATITPNTPHHAHTSSTTSNTNTQPNITAVSLPASSSISFSANGNGNAANKETPAASGAPSAPAGTSPTSPSSTTSSSSSLLSVPANFPLSRLSLAQNLISNGARLVDGLVNQKHSKQNGVQEILDYLSNRLEVGVNEWDDNTARAMAKLSSLCLVPANADYLVAHNGIEIVMEVLRRLGAPPPQLVAEMKLPKPSPKPPTPSVPSTTFPSPSHSPRETLYDTRTATSEDDTSSDNVPGVANINTDVNGIINKGKPPLVPSSNKKSPPPLPPTVGVRNMGMKKRLSLITEEPKFGLSVKLQKQTAAALRAAFSASGTSDKSATSSGSGSSIAANTFGTGPNQVIVGGQMNEHHAAIAAAAARVLARTAARPEHAKFICDSGGLLTIYSLVQQQVDMESDRIRPEFQIHRSQIIGAGLQALQQLVEGGERHHVEYVMDLDIGGLVSQCVDMHDLPRMEYVDQCAMQLLDTISTYDDDIAYVEQVANMSKHGGIAACVSILQHHMDDDGALLAVNMEAFRRVSLIDQFAGAGCVDVIYECGGYDMLVETLDQHVEDERIVNTSLAMLSAGCKHVPQVVTMLRNQNEIRGNLISQVQRQHPNHALIQQQADAIQVRVNKPPPTVACCGKCVIQ